MVNKWEELETGPNPPETIYAIVECLKGERNKYEYEKDIHTSLQKAQCAHSTHW